VSKYSLQSFLPVGFLHVSLAVSKTESGSLTLL